MAQLSQEQVELLLDTNMDFRFFTFLVGIDKDIQPGSGTSPLIRELERLEVVQFDDPDYSLTTKGEDLIDAIKQIVKG